MSARQPPARFMFALVPFASVVVFGTIGYMVIGGWSFFDALYFTVITVFGIGYGEHDPMTNGTRYFTVLIIILGFATLAYAGSILVQSVVESEVGLLLGKRRMEKELRNLKNHYIVCGAGRMGRRIVDEMARRGVEFLVVEADESKIVELRSEGHFAMVGDATNEDVLRHAGVERAAGIVCAVASDADNLFITLNARDLNKNLLIVARANDENAINRLRKAGADKVVSPIVTGSHQMAQMVLRPAVADFIDLATLGGMLELAIEQVEVRSGSPFIGVSMEEAALSRRANVMTVALKRAGGRMLFNPQPAAAIEPGDILVVVGSPADCERLERLVNPGRAGEAA